MKILAVCTGWMSQQHWISDHEKADAAYAALRTAMNSYDRFDNDKNRSVTIDGGTGPATFRIESLVSISLDDATASEDIVIERSVWEASIKAKVAARLAPAT